MSDEEDKYILQQEQDKLARERRERQLAALRDKERGAIAGVLATSEEVAEEALELGFDSETARILHLVPVIQVAWADDKLDDKEREKVLELASDRGVEPGSSAYEFLELLLDEKPSKQFFDRTNRVIAHLVADGGVESSDNLLELCRAVAEASGGFFGLTSAVSSEERELIDELAEFFSAKDASADVVLDD
jgi:hypothetical protein